MAIHHVAIGVGGFKLARKDQFIKTWSDLELTLNLRSANSGLMKKYGYRIEDRYEILEHQVPYPRGDGGQIIIVRKTPLSGENGLYRYFIWESKSGEIRDDSESEENLQAIFKSANARLPKSVDLPAVESENSVVSPAPDHITKVDPKTSVPAAGMDTKESLTKAVAERKPMLFLGVLVLSFIGLLGSVLFFLRKKRQ